MFNGFMLPEIQERKVSKEQQERESRKHKGLYYKVKESMYYSETNGVFHKKLTFNTP